MNKEDDILEDKIDLILKNQNNMNDRLTKIETNDLVHIGTSLKLLDNDIKWLKGIGIGLIVGIVIQLIDLFH
jgi:hypothetical protein